MKIDNDRLARLQKIIADGESSEIADDTVRDLVADLAEARGAIAQHLREVDDSEIGFPEESISSRINRLASARKAWKRRAEQHGCDVAKGDAECG